MMTLLLMISILSEYEGHWKNLSDINCICVYTGRKRKRGRRMMSSCSMLIALSLLMCQNSNGFVVVGSIARSSRTAFRTLSASSRTTQLKMAVDAIISPFDAASSSTLDDLVGDNFYCTLRWDLSDFLLANDYQFLRMMTMMI